MNVNVNAQWIDAKERLPEKEQEEVLVRIKYFDDEDGKYDIFIDMSYIIDGEWKGGSKDITHWMYPSELLKGVE